MERDTVIEIFGHCDDVDALQAIAVAAENDNAQREWNEMVGAEEVIQEMARATEGGYALRLTKEDSSYLLEETRAACQRAGLSYVVSSGPTSSSKYDEAIFYRSGGEELTLPLDVMNEVVPMRDVRDAAEHGIEAVLKMIRNYDYRTLKDVERKLTVAPEIIEALTDHTALAR